MTRLTDIFGQPVNIGDRVAVGMGYNRSSVLRAGEVISIKETPREWRDGIEYKWSIRIRWTHNGTGGKESWGSVDESTILHESTHTFAKLMVLPQGYAEQFAEDVVKR